jgi:hypothetical protein
VVAIAERPTDAPGAKCESDSAFARRPERIGLPPGSLPVGSVRDAIRSYRAGVTSTERLVAVVDLHGNALEREIARRADQDLTDFHRTIDRAAALAGSVSTRLAQLEWLRAFPRGPDREVPPLRCPVGEGRRVEIPAILAAFRAAQLPRRVARLAPARDAHAQLLDHRRGAGPAMAAIADAGISTTDIGLVSGIDRRKVWSVLNGHERAPPQLHEGLERLLGADQATAVLAAIPEHPRARAPTSGAVTELRAAGATFEDVAPLVPARPATVRKWLRGTLPLSPKLAPALEQLVGEAAAARILELIPRRNGADAQ